MLDEDDETYSFDYWFIKSTTLGDSGDDLLYVRIDMNMVENQY